LKSNVKNRSIFLRNTIFISEISQICNTRISIQERDANGINSFRSQCLTSALRHSYDLPNKNIYELRVRVVNEIHRKRYLSHCQTVPPFYVGDVPLARKFFLINIFPFTLSFVERFKRSVFMALRNNFYPLQRWRAPARSRRIIVISDKLYFDKRVSLPTGEFHTRVPPTALQRIGRNFRSRLNCAIVDRLC